MPEIIPPKRVVTYPGGAKRSTPAGKCRPGLISPIFKERLGWWLSKGADIPEYGPHNWEKGVPLSRWMEGMEDHLLAIQLGRTDEDHEAALAFNVMGWMHTREMIWRGKLPRDPYDDWPDYGEDRKGFIVEEPELFPPVGLPTPGEFLGEEHKKPADPIVQEAAQAADGPTRRREWLEHAQTPLRIYVSGPYTADTPEQVEANIERACEIGRQLAARGHDVHIPHAATRPLDGLPRERFMRLDLGLIERWANALYFIGPSLGAERERVRAAELGYPIFTRVEDVPDLEGVTCADSGS